MLDMSQDDDIKFGAWKTTERDRAAAYPRKRSLSVPSRQAGKSPHPCLANQVALSDDASNNNIFLPRSCFLSLEMNRY
jgi:hypothetical protein